MAYATAGAMIIAAFPFPSTGKAFPNEAATKLDMSLPDLLKFPFPSTGKAFPNEQRLIDGASVKDMFPFPSTGKAFPNPMTAVDSLMLSIGSFHSLQPGRHFRTSEEFKQKVIDFMFPFPSTGKAFPNRTMSTATIHG